MKCPNCHREIPVGYHTCPYCKRTLNTYNQSNNPSISNQNRAKSRALNKGTKILILVISIFLLLTAIIAGAVALLLHTANNNHSVPAVSSENAITRTEWIAMLADQEGYTDCKNDKSYFDDINQSNDNFKKIQACAEWEILDKGGSFLPNDKATTEFAVITAIKSIGLQFISANDKPIRTDSEIIHFYKEKTGDRFDNQSYIDTDYATKILNNTKQIKEGIKLKNSGSVEYKDNVKKIDTSSIKIQGNQATTLQPVQVGDILVIEPCDAYPSGKALKIKKVKGENIEFTTPGLDEFLGAYTFSGEASPVVTAVSSSDKDTTVKIETGNADTTPTVTPAAITPLALAGNEIPTSTSTNPFNYDIKLSKKVGNVKISGTISLKKLIMRVDEFNAVGITVKNCNAHLSYDLESKISVSGKAETKIPVRVDAKLFGVLGAAIKITVKIGIDGSVSVISSTTVTETMKYKQDALPIFRQTNTTPQTDLELKVKGYVNPEICIAGEVFNVDMFDFGGTIGVFNADASTNKYGCLDIKAYVPLDLFINSQDSVLGKLKIKISWKIWDSKSSKIKKQWHIESGKIVAKCTTPKPTTTKPATTQAEKHPTVGNWRKAYTNFLKQFLAEVDNPEACGFSLVYIDNDDAPELVVRDGDAHFSAAHVYTCINSKVVKLVGDLGGTFGVIGYIEKGELVSSDVCYHGVETTTIYRIDAGTCKKVVTLFNNAGDTPEGKTPTYEVNDKKVKKSEYTRAWKKYKDRKWVYSSDSDMILTLENIESIAS